MVISIDFGRGTKALVYRSFSELGELVPGVRYELPEPCVESSLCVYMNQGILERTSDNGFTVLSPTVFELKSTWPSIGTRHVLHVSYQPA